MRMFALIGAGLLAAGSLSAAAPAEAQRYGWHGYDGGYGPGWRYDRGWRGDRWRDGRRWRGPRYGYRPYRSRVVCRLRPGYYGPVRVCRRIWR